MKSLINSCIESDYKDGHWDELSKRLKAIMRKYELYNIKTIRKRNIHFYPIL